jgi:hypothetical protein
MNQDNLTIVVVARPKQMPASGHAITIPKGIPQHLAVRQTKIPDL